MKPEKVISDLMAYRTTFMKIYFLDLRTGMVGLLLKVCAVESKTAIVAVAWYHSVS